MESPEKRQGTDPGKLLRSRNAAGKQDIDVMKLILNLVLPEYERWHLRGLADNEQTYQVQVTKDLAASFDLELRHLLSLGLVERQE